MPIIFRAMNKARIALVAGIVSISIFPILVKLGLTSGLISAFYRMAIAFVLLLPVVFLTKQWQKPTLKIALLSALCGVLFGADVAVWNIAIQESSATQATLLTNLSPIWVGVGAFFVLADKPKLNFWIGTLVALLGMVTIVGFQFFLEMKFDRAFLFGILSGIFYSWYFLTSKGVLDKINVPTFMLINLFASTIFLGVLNWVAGEAFYGFSNTAWLVLFIQALVCQLFAWFALNFAISKMRATRVSLSLLGQALLTTILAWYFLSEPITLQMLVGGLILLTGIGFTFISTPIPQLLKSKRGKRRLVKL